MRACDGGASLDPVGLVIETAGPGDAGRCRGLARAAAGCRGLARFCSLRSWLSQWSYDESNADGVACAARVTVPGLVIGNMADVACTPSHHRRLFDALGSEDKEQHEIPGATHYYIGQRDELAESVSRCSTWLHERDLA